MYLFYIVIKRLAAKRFEKIKDVYICPKCGSIRLSIHDKLPPAARFIGAVPAQNFLCYDCDYEGIAPLIDKVEIDSFRKHLKKIKK